MQKHNYGMSDSAPAAALLIILGFLALVACLLLASCGASHAAEVTMTAFDNAPLKEAP